MLELGRKENQLLSGIGVQIVIVGFLVFAYTQAIRQVKHRADLLTRLREQAVLAREEVARQAEARPELALLQAQVAELKAQAIPPAALSRFAERLGSVAAVECQVEEVRVTVSDAPAMSILPPTGSQKPYSEAPEGGSAAEIPLYALKLTGRAASRQIASLIARASSQDGKPLTLIRMELFAVESGGLVPFALSWFVAVLPDAPEPKESLASALPPLEWGLREEPFSSPLLHPGAWRAPPGAGAQPDLPLTGIVWDGADPSCVIKGGVFRPGDWVEGYQLVLIQPAQVLVQKGEEERILRLN